ncbi:MAG: ribonuclease H-like domain-containing protein [Verrucomicrobiota bacterium]
MHQSKNLVYFDLETQKSAYDVGGWHNVSKMGLSIAVTYSTQRGAYYVYTEKEAPQLIQELQRADKVIGFNVLKFDYAVLSPYSLFDLSQVPTLDLMVSIEHVIGHRISLNAVAEASLGVGKTADGMEALKWWKQGKIREIAEYCCFDVKTTKLLHEYGMNHGKVSYVHSKTGLVKEIPVDW